MAKVSVPEEVRRVSRKRAPVFYGSLAKSQPATFERGQIWSTHSVFDLPNGQRFEADEPRLVVILNVNDRNLTVAPLSIQLTLASEYDLIVSDNDSPLSFDFIVEVWNETPMLANQLRRFLAKLPKHVVAWLDELYTTYLLEEETPSDLLDYVGPVLMGDEDYRREFQAAEVEAVKYLSRASTASLVTAEITAPEHVATSRPRIELGRPVWQILSDLPKAWNSKVAYAADTSVEENSTWVISVMDYPGTKFEMLIRKGRFIYILPHLIDDALRDKKNSVCSAHSERGITLRAYYTGNRQ